MSDVSSTSSGMTGAGGGSLLRITGMSTGLDVDAMVKKMMAAEQTKLDKAQQDQQTIQWKQDAYQDIIKDIKDLQSSFFDSSSSDKNILSSTNFSPFSVNSIDGGTVDTSVATFTPGVGAQTGQYSIKVTQLAAGAGISNKSVKTSSSATPASTKATLSTKLTDIDSSLTGDITLAINVSGATSPINITLKNPNTATSGTATYTATLGDLVNAINNQGNGSVKASYSELTGEFKLNTAATGDSTSLTIKSGSTAALSNIIGFSTDNSGTHTGTGITGTATSSDWVANSTTVSEAITGATASNGKNANVTITPPGGAPVTVTDKTSNNFTIDGMTYRLSSTSATAATVNVGSDTSKVFDKIKGFIDKYNTIVDKIQTKLTEKKNSTYKPLTDTQKESMSSSQITAWETKAKVGILRNDNNLQKMLNDLRTAFTTGVSNVGLSLGRYGDNNIGIDTSKDYSTPGHIDLVDESKLKTAILTNGDQILKMFTNVSAATTASDKPYDGTSTEYKEDGIFTRMKSIIQTNVGFTNTTLNTATLTAYANKQYDYSTTGSGGKNTIPDQLYKQQIMITKIKATMSTKQEQYYKKFSQLETAMTTLNAQQSQLSSLTG